MIFSKNTLLKILDFFGPVLIIIGVGFWFESSFVPKEKSLFIGIVGAIFMIVTFIYKKR